MTQTLTGGAEEEPQPANPAAYFEINRSSLDILEVGDQVAVTGLGGFADPDSLYRRAGNAKRDSRGPVFGVFALQRSRDIPPLIRESLN